ncbi:sensor histidine kinase [Agilicoccus flavus]|uniref:sensor histidine kinase n=1 Tax=Agilicoccus flavus TaxID=2775968 RepID=UPI001CF70138|nr:PAS domain-containing sensor histidine kinase [Agilicoccus flavus]
MSTLTELLTEATDLRGRDAEWLHLLVSDWQMLADLWVSDLVLWVRRPGTAQEWFVATHVRPNTGALVFYDDLVGRSADEVQCGALQRCAEGRRILSGTETVRYQESSVREQAVPVVRKGRVLAVLTRHTNLDAMRTPSRLEVRYRDTADTLAGMISRGEFPTVGAPTGMRRGAPRVGDGVILLDADGQVLYASPNATSALHRLGHQEEIIGADLARIVSDRITDHTVVDEALVLVLTGRAPWWTEAEAGGVSLTMRAIPLTDAGTRTGALLLVRDVSELRRRDRELLTKDATIREIHHRVKNNLQTVAALLRLQSRRVGDAGAKTALQEAGRRVATIALVHDTLSQTLDDDVDFDGVISRALNAVAEVASEGGRLDWRLEGSFGRLGAEDATTLAMIVTELVQNAAEHGVADGGGSVVVEARRSDSSTLTVTVTDDGAGLPEGFRPGVGGLGTQIVQAFVQDLRGEIVWEAARPRGTRVRFVARLRPLRPSRSS